MHTLNITIHGTTVILGGTAIGVILHAENWFDEYTTALQITGDVECDEVADAHLVYDFEAIGQPAMMDHIGALMVESFGNFGPNGSGTLPPFQVVVCRASQ